jgi:dTDP-glucose pyrophosphorylase
MLNIVIPMAGAGSRFIKNGYTDPKPLIKIHGIEMIRLVIENLRPSQPHKFIFICQKEHLDRFKLKDKLKSWGGGPSEVLTVQGLTEGAACTVLLARNFINNSNPLMIANCDQYIDIKIDDYLLKMESLSLDGLIMTLKSNDPKWSYAKINQDGYVENLVEKEVISDHATVGIYNFARGSDFVDAADQMITNDLRVNDEFYVAPTYNQLIKKEKKIRIFDIGREGERMFGLGIPADLEFFIRSPVSKICQKL